MKRSASTKLAFVVVAASLFLTMATIAGAQPGEFVKGVLQPLADGFPKRAINVVVVDDPGSREDLYVKSFQAALKGVSPVPITVSDEPSAVGGVWHALQDIRKRDGGKEGYYPFSISAFGVVTDLLVEPGTREIGAKLEQMNMIISTEFMPYVMIQRKNAPWGRSFAGMVKYGKENPGKLRYISWEIGSGIDISCEWVLKTVGVTVQKIPQGTVQECASTVGAGEGDFTMATMDQAITNMQTGRVDITMVLGSTVPEIVMKSNPEAVSAKQAGLSTTIKGTILGLAVPSDVPQERVDWLYKLFNFAAHSELHQKRSQLFPSIQFNIIDGKAANAENRQIYEFAEPIIRSIGLHIDDIKKK